MKYRIIRDEKDKTVTIKKWFSIVAVYSGDWWNETDEVIFNHFIEGM